MPFITFLALKNISLPEFTTLNMSSPLVGAILAFFILKEKLNIFIYTSLFLVLPESYLLFNQVLILLIFIF